MTRRDWTREELIVAFNLYCKIPFGRIHIRNPLIIELADSIGRTPSAVSWKLANFARLDPALQKRNIAGAAHGARAEIDIWNEFNQDWEKLAFESERLLEKMTGKTPKADLKEEFPEGKTRETLVRTRINQGFFRAAVLAAYGVRCCITGLSIPQLLNASHIVQWKIDVKNRNGFVHVVETFPIDQADGVVCAGESFAFLGLVLEDSTVEVVGHADVEGAAGATLHDVDVVVMFAEHELAIHCHPARRTGSALGGTGAQSRDLVFS